jgi:hypothetical protein
MKFEILIPPRDKLQQNEVLIVEAKDNISALREAFQILGDFIDMSSMICDFSDFQCLRITDPSSNRVIEIREHQVCPVEPNVQPAHTQHINQNSQLFGTSDQYAQNTHLPPSKSIDLNDVLSTRELGASSSAFETLDLDAATVQEHNNSSEIANQANVLSTEQSPAPAAICAATKLSLAGDQYTKGFTAPLLRLSPEILNDPNANSGAFEANISSTYQGKASTADSEFELPSPIQTDPFVSIESEVAENSMTPPTHANHDITPDFDFNIAHAESWLSDAQAHAQTEFAIPALVLPDKTSAEAPDIPSGMEMLGIPLDFVADDASTHTVIDAAAFSPSAFDTANSWRSDQAQWSHSTEPIQHTTNEQLTHTEDIEPYNSYPYPATAHNSEQFPHSADIPHANTCTSPLDVSGSAKQILETKPIALINIRADYATTKRSHTITDLTGVNGQYRPGLTTEMLTGMFMQAIDIYECGSDRQAAMQFMLDLIRSDIQILGAAISLTDINHPDKEIWFEAAIGPAAELMLNLRVPSGQGFIGYSVQQGVSLNTPNVQSEPLFAQDVLRDLDLDIGPVLCVPIICERRIYGAITLYRASQQRPFTQGEVSIINYLTHVIGEYLSQHADKSM